MKTSERHHLKENDFAQWVGGVRQWYEANQNRVLYGGIALVVVIVAIVATILVRQNSVASSSRMLAEAMAIAEAPVMPPTAGEAGKPPLQAPGTYPSDKARLEAALPKLMAVADAYPAADSGLIARYRAAAALVAVGRTDEGIQRYKEVSDKGPGIFQTMAKLGIAEAYVQAGKYDQAIADFKAISQQPGDDTPVDGVLMGLARAYKAAGKTDDARKTFKRVVDEFPQSPYAQIARREIDAP